MTQFFIENASLMFKLFLAVILGVALGAERVLAHKEAGMKTHGMVSLGAALFVIISELLFVKYSSVSGFDPSRIASQIVVGIGFLGAGSIMFRDSRLSGLTTATGLWVTAGIGMAAGFGFYSLAIIVTVLVLIILVVVNMLERPVIKISKDLNRTSELE